MSKLLKPRRHEGKVQLQLSFDDGMTDLDLREGNTPLMRVRQQKFQNLNEVLEMLNKKL